MMSFSHFLGIATVLVGLPTALVTSQDYLLHRAARKEAEAVIDVRLPVAPMPAERARTSVLTAKGAPSAPTPTQHAVRPAAATMEQAHARMTAKIGMPLSVPRRLLAGIIDLYGTYFTAALAALALADPTYEEDAFAAAFGLFLIAGLVAIVALNAKGRSPGKMVVGARLVRHSDRTQSVGFWRSAGRFVLALFVPFSSWFVMGTSRRALHDRMTDTLVIRSR